MNKLLPGFGEFSLLRQIIDNLPVALFCKDPANNFAIKIWNKECERQTGIKAIDALGKVDKDLWDKTLCDRITAMDRQVIAENKLLYIKEFYIRPLNRPAYWARSWKMPLVGDDGSKLLLGISLDVSEEVRLAEKDRVNNAVLVNSPGMYFQATGDQVGNLCFTFVSSQSLDIFGVPPDVAVSDASTIIGQIEDLADFKSVLEKSAAEMTKCVWEGRYVDRKGRVRWLKGSAAPTREPDGRMAWNGVLFETTAVREAQELVRKKEIQLTAGSRLAALGEMAGAIAHEINTPLTTFLLAAERIESISETTSPSGSDMADVNQFAKTLVETTHQISKIINGLRRFARDGSSDPLEPTDVGGIIDHALSLCKERFNNHSVKLRVEPFPEKAFALCRGVEIGQVILNLLNNSFDAVVGKPEPWVRVSVEKNGSHIDIKVVDSGKGISAEVAARIFEPFFTTKGPSKGTGLGLSVSHGIIDRHGGSLRIDPSAVNTTFIISLPKN